MTLHGYFPILVSMTRLIKLKRMRWAGHVARMGEGRGVYRVLMPKSEGKRTLGRPGRRCEVNIKMGLQQEGSGTVVKVLCYKSEGRWVDPSDHIMALGSTQPLTEMSTRIISWG